MRTVLALFLIACGTDAGHYPPGNAPIIPGTSGARNPPDAGAVAGDAGTTTITGQLCAITDVRTLTPCTPLTGTTLTVSANGTTAQVGADGRFTLPAAAGAQVTLVTSTDDRTYFGTAVVAQAGAIVSVPVLRQIDVTDLAISAGVTLAPGSGILVVHTAAGATLDAIGGALPYYDTAVAGQLTSQPPTGPNGVAVFFNVVGPATVTIHGSGTMTRTVPVRVVADTVTFVSAPL